MTSEPTATILDSSQFSFDMSTEGLDHLPAALVILGLDGTVRVVNRAALKLLNVHTSDVIGRHFSYFLRSLDPPLLAGGFAKLLELGNATFDVALRCGEDRFIQIETQLTVIYDEQARRSGVLAMSSEGDAEDVLVRRAGAAVANQVSRMIVHSPSNKNVWVNLFEFCQRLFEASGGWIILREGEEAPHIPYVFGPLDGLFEQGRDGIPLGVCPCSQACAPEEISSINMLDCPWLMPGTTSTNADRTPHHHSVTPIVNSVGERKGDICLVAPAGRAFHHHELAMMDAIADQIGQALDRGEITFPQRLAAHNRLSSLSFEEHNLELMGVLEKILKTITSVVPFVSAGVFLQEPAGLRLMASINHPQAQDMRGLYFPYGDNELHLEILQKRSRIILDDVHTDPRFQSWGGLDYIRSWMGLPLIVNESVIGVITLDREEIGAFTTHEGVLAQAFADQAAVAVERARLVMELAKDKRNLELLYQLGQSLVTVLEPEAVAEKALELLSATFGGCYGEIYVAENGEEYLQLLATIGHRPDDVAKLPDQPYLRSGVGIIGMSVEMRRPVLVPNVIDDPRWVWLPELNLTVRSVASIPLISRNEVVGALVLGSPEINTFTADYSLLLQSIAGSVALALQNARLFAAERHRRQEAEMLRNATSALTLDLRLEQVMDILLERLQQVVGFDSACVMLLDGEELYAMAQMGLPRPDEVLGHRFPVENSFFAGIQQTQRAIYFDDVQKLPRFSGWGGTSSIHAWMGVPLIHRGDTLGYITLDSFQPGAYGEREAILAQAFANQMAITLINARLLNDSQRAVLEQQEISAILHGLNAAASSAEIHTAIAGGLRRLIGPAALELALYQADEQRVIAQRSHWTDAEGSGEELTCTYAFDESAVTSSLLQGQSHTSTDVTEESHWPVEGEWASLGYRARTALPLRGNEGVLGHIQLFWREQSVPSHAMRFSLNQITDGVAMAVEKLNLWQQATRRADDLQVLMQLSTALRAAEEREQAIRTFLDSCREIFHADRGYLLMPATDKNGLEVVAHVGTGPLPQLHFGYSDSIVGKVFCSGTPYCAPNLFTDSIATSPALQLWAKKDLTFVSGLYAPLRAGDRIVGVVALNRFTSRRAFLPMDMWLLNAIAEIAGGALHRIAILEGLERRVSERTADLAQANAQLLELDQMKSDFVSNVSHELRTPLTNIRLYLELLGSGRAERRSHYLQVAQQETEQLQALIESILALSALNENRAQMAFSFENVLLNGVAETVFERFRQQAAGAGLHFIYQPPPQPWTVWGSREHLLSLCANLVSNAIRYTQPGGSVEITLKENGQGKVGILIRDTGMGIHPDEIPLIFERFYRSTAVKQSDILGTGLGLSIVNEVAQAHGAYITVDSEPHAGTTFAVWFPLSGQDPRPGEKIDVFQ